MTGQPPKLIILCQLFYPELISTGQTVTELAEALVAQGVDLEVVAGPPTVMDRRTKIPRRMTLNGIRIFRVWGTRFPKLSLVGKLVNHMTYTMSVFLNLMTRKIDRPVLVFTNPPFVVGACALASIFRPIRMIYVIFDVYPDTAVQAGVLNPQSLTTRLWHRFNAFCFSRSEKIVVIGRCMERVIRARLPMASHPKLVRMHVWADEAGIQQNPTGSYREKWGIADQFVLGYSGNLGRFHDIDTIIAAAAAVHDRSAKFVFVGEGYSKAGAQALVAQEQLDNVQFHSYVPREDLGAVLSAFDVGLVALKKGQEGLSVPSKTFGIMAAGKPIIGIMAADSEVGLIIRETGCGWVVEPGDVAGLVLVIQTAMSLSRDELAAMGECGRRASMEKYTVGHAAKAVMGFCEVSFLKN